MSPVTSVLCSEIAPVVGPDGASGPLGYIRLATFNGKTAEAFRDAVFSLRVRSCFVSKSLFIPTLIFLHSPSLAETRRN